LGVDGGVSSAIARAETIGVVRVGAEVGIATAEKIRRAGSIVRVFRRFKVRVRSLLMSQGVISHNYNNSQYNSLILDLIIKKEESRVTHLTTYTCLALSRSLCESLGLFAF
jgi:hypothetical protein